MTENKIEEFNKISNRIYEELLLIIKNEDKDASLHAACSLIAMLIHTLHPIQWKQMLKDIFILIEDHLNSLEKSFIKDTINDILNLKEDD